MGRAFIPFILIFLGLFAADARGVDKPKDKTESKPTKSKQYLMWHFSPSDGATPELTSKVENTVRAWFAQNHSDLLMDGMVMDSLLLVEGNEKYLRCGSGARCLSGLGELAGVKYVIAGEVSLVSHQTITTLLLVDVETKKVKLRATIHSMGVPSRKKIKELSIAMFEPERYIGSIAIVCPVSDAKVFLDGKLLGNTPVSKPLEGVVAGEHLLELKKAGRQPFAKTINVPLGEKVKVMAVLPELPFLTSKPRPFYADWPFWTSAGVGVIALAAAGALYHSAGVYQENADKLRDSHSAGVDAEQDKADSKYLQSYVMFGVGGAGILASGVIALIDIISSGDSDGEKEATGPSFHLLPAASGIGIGTLITF